MVSLLVSEAFFRGLVVGVLGGSIWLVTTVLTGVIPDPPAVVTVWLQFANVIGYALMIAGPFLASLDLFMGVHEVMAGEDPEDEILDLD